MTKYGSEEEVASMLHTFTDVLTRAGEVLIDGTEDEIKVAQALASAADAIDKKASWSGRPRTQEEPGDEIINQIGEVIAALALYPSNDRAKWNPKLHPATVEVPESAVKTLEPRRDKIDAASALEAAHAYLSAIHGVEEVTLARIVEALKLL